MWFILMPYIFLVIIYIFVFGVHKEDPPPGSITSAIFKCLPVAYLLFLMVIVPWIEPHQSSYRYAICAGYIFSLIGDCCLNWPKHYFVQGLVFFALAQLSYTYALGFSPFGLPTMLVYCVVAALILKVIIPNVKQTHLRVAVIFYVLLLGLVGWRATVRYKERRHWDTWMAMVAAIIFATSDFLIAFNRWKVRFSRAVLFIMMTYYVAQLMYASSVLLPVFEAVRKIRFMGV
ncbi:hypothetical protein LSH36_204g10038 [Paralvinella palmiformis]|uniref:lysoplasmalogenase n=1 Tax=Paralvinella palmiformis TaxID=53620 RepID=A0AAD9N4I4_9ANNE|nr:hypothetical protein LSH36_204g10038 [Paralvinella palmiformis]